jgi:profilin
LDQKEKEHGLIVCSYQVSPQEMTEVVTAFKDTSDVKKVQSTGLHIAGEKFIVLKADDRSLYGKKVRLNT